MAFDGHGRGGPQNRSVSIYHRQAIFSSGSPSRLERDATTGGASPGHPRFLRTGTVAAAYRARAAGERLMLDFSDVRQVKPVEAEAMRRHVRGRDGFPRWLTIHVVLRGAQDDRFQRSKYPASLLAVGTLLRKN